MQGYLRTGIKMLSSGKTDACTLDDQCWHAIMLGSEKTAFDNALKRVAVYVYVYSYIARHNYVHIHMYVIGHACSTFAWDCAVSHNRGSA